MKKKQKYADMHPGLLHVAIYQLQAQKITDRQTVLVLEYRYIIYVFTNERKRSSIPMSSNKRSRLAGH
jgi:hypothetical protein